MNTPKDASIELQKIIIETSRDTLKRYLLNNRNAHLEDFTCHGFGKIEKEYMAYVGINIYDEIYEEDLFNRRLLIQSMDDGIRTETMRFEGETKIKINVFKRHKFCQSKNGKKVLFIGYYWNTA